MCPRLSCTAGATGTAASTRAAISPSTSPAQDSSSWPARITLSPSARTRSWIRCRGSSPTSGQRHHRRAHAAGSLAGLGSASSPPRVLGAVLAVAGPAAALALLSAGRAAHTPDGQAAIVYDGPAAAIRDALAVLGGPQGRGTRLGLQIAEVPRTGPVVDGPGVEAAVGLAKRAAPGQLLVSPAVRDLVADAGPSFTPVGDDAYRPG